MLPSAELNAVILKKAQELGIETETPEEIARWSGLT
jgi:hypothetical protein